MKLFTKHLGICSIFLLTSAVSVWAQGDAKDLYLSKCAACHGPDGTGKTAMGKKLKVQDAHAAVAKMTAEQMIKVVTDGKGQDMSGYGKQFSAEQIKSLVDYYRALGK